MGLRVGIDLGTTNSVVSYVRGGRPEVVANLQGEYWTPSVVQDLGGRVLVGKEAKENMPFVPQATIWSIKRFIGRSPGDVELERARKLVPYTIEDPPPGKTDLLVSLGGKKHTPIDVSAMILRKLVDDTEASLGERPTDAVITVPAYFSERQKEATRQAGRAAGLKVQRVLDEPTAAALAYGMDSDPDAQKTLLVFDLGGGTFDVSLLMLTSGMFTTLKITGDNFLGGDDFDNVILQRLLELVKQQTGGDHSADPKVRAQLKKVAEGAKIALSSSNVHPVDSFIPPEGNRPLIALSTRLERAWFEQATRHLVDRAMEQVHRALKESETGVGEVDHVLMVGGSSRIPQVLKGVEQLFGASKISRQLNPMLCVAQGAAILAQTIAEGKSEDDLVVRVTSKPLGIALANGDFDVIIARETPYPMEEPHRGRYKTTEPNQREIRIEVFEGEEKKAEANEWVGDVMARFGEDLSQGTSVDVAFRLDRDGVQFVTVDVAGRPGVVKDARVERGERKKKAEPAKPPPPGADRVLRFLATMQKACAGILRVLPRDAEMVKTAVTRLERAIELGDPAETEKAVEAGNKCINEVHQDVYIYFIAWNEVANPENPTRGKMFDEQLRVADQALASGDNRGYNAAMETLAKGVEQVLKERGPAGAGVRPGGLSRR
jgi:molecular chaperone DnaK